MALANFILALHFAIITFNVAGLIVIPLGAACRWRFIRIAWLRWLHLTLLFIVAAQAISGRACILTIWQNELTGNRTAPEPMIMHWLNGLIYWNLPIWVFAVLYSAVFLYVVALWVFIPFGRRWRSANEHRQA
jgi:hypothetical protein